MNKHEQLAIVVALRKKLEELEHDLNADCKYDAIEAWNECRAGQYRIYINEQDVGTYSVTVSKPQWVITNREAYEPYALEHGFGHEVRFVDIEMIREKALMEAFPKAVRTVTELEPLESVCGFWKACGDIVYDRNGELVPGIKLEPMKAKSASCRIKIDKVLAACTADDVMHALGGAVPALEPVETPVLEPVEAPILEGGFDE